MALRISRDQIFDTLRKAGEQVADKVEAARESVTLTLEISNRESELADLYRELGRVTYEMSRNEMSAISADALLSQVDGKVREIAELKARKAELVMSDACPTCGRDLVPDAFFCHGCGAKIELPTEEEKAGDDEAAAEEGDE